jgi:ABC-type sugar transport system substrate-binding protein
MKKNKITFLILECIFLILTLFFAWKIFDRDVPEKRVAVILPESGDNRWNSLIKGMKQSAKINNLHMIICNTDEIENADEEKNLIYDQLDNQVDAFIVQAAPGRDTIDMLREIRVQKPMLLVANDALREKEEDHISKYSDLPVITPDYYRMGYTLAQDLLSRNQNNIQGKTVGIISGFKKTDCTDKCMQGVLDVLSDTGCEIQFDMNITYDMEITQRLKEQQPVDYLIVFDTSALEQVAGMYAQKKESDTKIYGIGNSIKCVYYLDDSVIDGLIAIDGYGMGYHSAIEISKVLKNHLYTINNQTIEYHLLHKEDIFREEVQHFLHTYD